MDWDRQSPTVKIDDLATQSDDLLQTSARGPSAPDSTAGVRAAAANPSDIHLLIWPQTSLPFMGTNEGEAQLYDRLQRWTSQRGIMLLAGAETAPEGLERSYRPPRPGELANSAVLFQPGEEIVRYDQMRSVPFADRKAAQGTDRVLFHADGADIATAVGFESVFGNHIRQFPR